MGRANLFLGDARQTLVPRGSDAFDGLGGVGECAMGRGNLSGSPGRDGLRLLRTSSSGHGFACWRLGSARGMRTRFGSLTGSGLDLRDLSRRAALRIARQ